MLERNPASRKSAEIYLAQERGKIFPEYFYSFLQSYMLIFSAAPILSPDEKINRLKKDIGNIINILKSESEDKPSLSDSSNSDILKLNDENNSESLNTDSEGKENDSKLSDASENRDNHDEEKAAIDVKTSENLEGLIIITQLVTSCIRGLHHSQSKLQSLDILLELAENTTDETILDRILPYIVGTIKFFFS